MDETERITRDRRLVKKTKDCCWSHGKLQVTGCLKAFNVRGGQPCTQSDYRLSFKAIAEWKAGKETFSSEPAAEYSTVDPQDGRHLHSIFMMKFSPTPVTKSQLSQREELPPVCGDSTYQKYPLFSYHIISVLFTYTRPYKISLSPDFSFIHSFCDNFHPLTHQLRC